MKSGSKRPTRRAALALPVALALGLTLPAPAARAAAKVGATPKTFAYNTSGVIRSGNGSVRGPNQLSFSGIPSATYVTGSGQPIQLGQFVVNPTAGADGSPAVTTYNRTPFVIQVHAPQFDKSKSVPVLSRILPSFGRDLHLRTQTINSLLVRGHLDGTVSGNGTSTVTATVDSTKLGSIRKAPKSTSYDYTFPVRSTELKLPTSWTMNTTARALAGATPPPFAAPAPAGAVAAAPPAAAAPASAPPVAPAAPAAQEMAGGAVVAGGGLGPAEPAPSITAALAQARAAEVLPVPAAQELTAAAMAPTPTPEPSTFAIFGAALAGLAWNRRRRSAR